MKNSSEICNQMTQCQSNSEFQKVSLINLAQSAQVNSPLQVNVLLNSVPITPNNGDQADLIFEIGLPKVLTRRMTKNDYLTTADGHKTKQEVFCNNCQRINMTRLETEYGLGAIQITCLLIFLFWPLCWLPCVLRSCKDIIHYCPFCNQVVGRTRYTFC
ncbi:unnamed protein product [Paramecium primaurelia]|uniref:LITAF domain-containing protein n=1 Tax=Paramecium primaurelia TaxID=5886 RepID=A0A8S1KLP4_PARPR|nr:unnamed protein product [Paramecium primaurelia]